MCSSCVGDQTGSGKTFTITGGASRYVDRGIIPRTLSYIFKYFQEVCVCVCTCVCLCMHACVCACVSCMYYSLHWCVQSPEKIFSVHVSYLEIYNEHGYDLLDPRHEASKLDDLPLVNRACLQVVKTVITCLVFVLPL